MPVALHLECCARGAGPAGLGPAQLSLTMEVPGIKIAWVTNFFPGTCPAGIRTPLAYERRHSTRRWLQLGLASAMGRVHRRLFHFRPLT
ncbi:hypothetical protein PSAB6_50235 [Paraburkholderia sabiae]|nr:hypothetical protein PSAB6_50235 [Paraburkholderia sabiae]